MSSCKKDNKGIVLGKPERLTGTYALYREPQRVPTRRAQLSPESGAGAARSHN